MKKRLEAELISIAHRILKLKSKSDVDQLYKETQKLYETLTVLKFYQDNFETVKLDVAQDVLEEKLAQGNEIGILQEEVTENQEKAIEPNAVAEVETEASAVAIEIPAVEDESFEDNDVVEKNDHEDHEEEILAENEPEEVVFKPSFELAEEEEEEATEVKPEVKQVSMQELLGENYVDPVFVKPNDVSLFSTPKIEEIDPKSATLNDVLSKSIAIGLNDRVGFVKHLFDDNNEDFNRVLSQLNTFDSYEEAKNFIEDMVKPDYNNWKGEEDYEERFMEVVAKKFL